MMEVYVYVQRKRSLIRQLFDAFILSLGVVSLVFSCLVQPFFIVLVVILGAAWYFLHLYSNQEFEYSYFDGDVRFAKVLNKSRRKTLKGYTMDEVLQIAPAGDPSVVKYEQDSRIKKKNYTSHFQGAPYYEMVVRDEDNETVMIMFEPDEKYLDAVCMKYKHKVIRCEKKVEKQ